MYKFIFLLLSFSTVLTQCAATDAAGPVVYTAEEYAFNDSLQTTIYDAFVATLISNDLNKLMIVDKDLTDTYWKAYLRYYKGIYHLKADDKKASEQAIDRGVELLDEKTKKNSEDYALLAMLKNFNIQFAEGMKAGMLSSQVQKACKTAIKIDPNNPRAYYVMGASDFYTPEKYGGGKNTEEYLTKSISLPNDGPITWSREEAYELLIRHYIKKEEIEKARTTFRAATKLFPDSYQINQLAKKLI